MHTRVTTAFVALWCVSLCQHAMSLDSATLEAMWLFDETSGNVAMDSLLSRGGMASMLPTVWLILMAMVMGGAYNSGVLGVATLSYLPFCFFNLLSPLVSLFLAMTNWTIERKVVEARGPTSLDTPA